MNPNDKIDPRFLTSPDGKPLLFPGTPLVFCDGQKVYNKLAEKYLRHSRGLFIVAPSGAGKTYFTKSQKEKHWIDGDELWMATDAHPAGAWWEDKDNGNSLNMKEIDAKSDIVTMEAKKLGFWIIGASNLWLVPDAVVIPDWELHKSYINNRQNNNYDGGATNDRLQQVINHRERIIKHAKDNNVPIFKSVDDAVKYLTS